MPRWLTTTLLIILAVNTGWFVVHAFALGLGGLTNEAPGDLSRVFLADATVANGSLALHMIAGAVLTIAAPLQALPVVRHRWNGLHRRLGAILVALAGLTGLGGLGYIALQGTIGGWWMSLWFAIYGLCMIGAAAATAIHAARGDIGRHHVWATRLVILAVGSWIYRMHYVIWYGLTDGAASNDAFTGLFDQIQVFAFFLPYLILAEVFLRRGRQARAEPQPSP